MNLPHLWDEAAYQAQLRHLFGLRRGAEGRGLSGMMALWDALGRPGEGIACIQVAGTNGKGSVSAWLSSMLCACGERVGLFTSPHLIHFRERYRVNEQDVADEVIARWLPRVLEAASQTGYPPLFFEIVTALGMCLFAEAKVNWIVLEVGLGGRLDPTSVIPSVASVITSIGLDHCAWLGTTLGEIAAEKAGIFRQGVPVWVGKVPKEAALVISEEAKRKGVSSISWSGQDFFVEGDGLSLRFVGAQRELKDLSSPLSGLHQKDNLALSLAVCLGLEQRGLVCSSEALRLGVQHVRWSGRLQRVSWEERTLWVDGAHNPEAAEMLYSSLCKEPPSWLIFGAMEDKDAMATLEPLLRLTPHVVFCTVGTSRAMRAVSLLESARQQFSLEAAFLAEGVEEALLWVKEHSVAGDCVLVAGSLFLVGEALASLGEGARETKQDSR